MLSFVMKKQQLKALDNVANTPKIRNSFEIEEDPQSSVPAPNVSQYIIARHPVGGLTQWEEHPSTPPVEPLVNETDAVVSHRSTVYFSTEEG